MTTEVPGGWTLRPPRLSADLATADGRTVHVPDVPPPAEPATAGRVRITIPYPRDAARATVTAAAVTNAELGVTFRAVIEPVALEPGDTLTAEFGEEHVSMAEVARALGEGAVTWTDKEMSNLDRTVDPGMAEDLRAGMTGCHNAWNFHGEVWYDAAAGVFREEVSVYRVPRGTFSAPTLEELMRVVSGEFGWD